VWIIFDELSQEIAFEKRPPTLRLPNFDHLRAESFYASAARSPSNSTVTSLPALIIGQHVAAAAHPAPNRLLLTVPGCATAIEWNEAPNIFDVSRQMGYNTALVGWFHPYGRLLNHSLTRCYWTAGWLLPGIEEPTEPSLVASLCDRATLQFVALPLIGHLPWVNPEHSSREAKCARFAYLVERAQEIATLALH
jgi:hypothetical protein